MLQQCAARNTKSDRREKVKVLIFRDQLERGQRRKASLNLNHYAVPCGQTTTELAV